MDRAGGFAADSLKSDRLPGKTVISVQVARAGHARLYVRPSAPQLRICKSSADFATGGPNIPRSLWSINRTAFGQSFY